MNKEKFCCESFPKYAKTFNWMTYVDANKISVYLMPHFSEHKFRLNHCPTCGANIRSIEIDEQTFNTL